MCACVHVCVCRDFTQKSRALFFGGSLVLGLPVFQFSLAVRGSVFEVGGCVGCGVGMV